METTTDVVAHYNHHLPEVNVADIMAAITAPETMITNFAYAWFNNASLTGMWYMNKDFYKDKDPQFIILKALPKHSNIWYHVLPNTNPLEEGKILSFANTKTGHLNYKKRDGNTVRLTPETSRATTEILLGIDDPYAESYYKNMYNVPLAFDEKRDELRCFHWRDFSQPVIPKRGILPPPAQTLY